MTLTFSPDWVWFQAPLVAPVDVERWHWYEMLLAVSDQLYLAKATLTPERELCLRMELPSTYFDAIHFDDALEAVDRYRRLYGAGFERAPLQLWLQQAQTATTPRRWPLPRAEFNRMFAHLEKEGWRLSGEPSGDNWRVRYFGTYKHYFAYVTFTGDWIYFPIAGIPRELERRYHPTGAQHLTVGAQ